MSGKRVRKRKNTKLVMVTFYTLLRAVGKHVPGYPGAIDDLYDLWIMGAPSPHRSHTPCPKSGTGQDWCAMDIYKLAPKCGAKFGCARIRRVLLPAQFASWWKTHASRSGSGLTPEQIINNELN